MPCFPCSLAPALFGPCPVPSPPPPLPPPLPRYLSPSRPSLPPPLHSPSFPSLPPRPEARQDRLRRGGHCAVSGDTGHTTERGAQGVSRGRGWGGGRSAGRCDDDGRRPTQNHRRGQQPTPLLPSSPLLQTSHLPLSALATPPSPCHPPPDPGTARRTGCWSAATRRRSSRASRRT